MKKILLVLTLLSVVPLCAQVRVFLKARHYIRSEGVALIDIADVSGSAELAEKAKQCEIPVDLYRDGFVDRSELESLLVAAGYPVKVYGSAIRILPKSMAPKISPSVVKGDIVDVVVKRGRVTIRMRGESMGSADEGERISVFVNGRKRMQGILGADKTVFVGNI